MGKLALPAKIPFLKLLITTGPLVEILACASSPCQFGGTCEELIDGYKCNCTAPHEGVHCERSKYQRMMCSERRRNAFEHLTHIFSEV